MCTDKTNLGVTAAAATDVQTWSISSRHPVGDGPWVGEPDRKQWIDPATDLDCLVLRNHLGVFCGYIGLPPGHPWHGQSYDEIGHKVDVHGGLTFANRCAEVDGIEAICHVPAPGRPADVWWLGFDCGHPFDLVPPLQPGSPLANMYRYFLPPSSPSDTYRDLDYVSHEVTNLAAQLADVGGNN